MVSSGSAMSYKNAAFSEWEMFIFNLRQNLYLLMAQVRQR